MEFVIPNCRPTASQSIVLLSHANLNLTHWLPIKAGWALKNKFLTPKGSWGNPCRKSRLTFSLLDSIYNMDPCEAEDDLNSTFGQPPPANLRARIHLKTHEYLYAPKLLSTGFALILTSSQSLRSGVRGAYIRQDLAVLIVPPGSVTRHANQKRELVPSLFQVKKPSS